MSAWTGGVINDTATCLLAPNPSGMTLEGTNTWLLRDPDTGASALVDVGPDIPAHVEACLDAARSDGPLAALLVTHHHPDHVDANATLQTQTGMAVRGMGCGTPGSDDLADGEHIAVGGLAVRVIHTPGHTADSVSLLVEGHGLLLTGDTVLGRGTTVVMHPDGSIADYLATLDTLEHVITEHDVHTLLPGHGPIVANPLGAIHALRQHRHERLDQVRSVIAAHPGATTDELVDAVVRDVYADVPDSVIPAARLSVQAQVAYLTD